ncbi:MAG: phage tail protein [Pyrinomonadaceae bacterium]
MQQSEIRQLLPEIFQRTLREGNPLTALLGVMEALHAPSEAVLDRLDAMFNPRRTTDPFVPFLAYWVDLDRLFEEEPTGKWQVGFSRHPMTSGLGRLRELIATAAYLSQWRGTKKGLLLFLQTATGSEDFNIDEQVPDKNGEPRPFHIKVTAPAESAPHEHLIERIIELEKPAYVTYELVFAPPVT